MPENEIVLYTLEDGSVTLEVRTDPKTVWLTQEQMSLLFDRDRTVITKHIKNIFSEGELNKESNVQNMHIASSDKPVTIYNLNVIISVGYRVKSVQGTRFRIWATEIINTYLLQGYVINQKRLQELEKVVQVLKRTGDTLEAKQILSVIEQYTYALEMLDDYDHQRITKPAGTTSNYILTYEECIQLVQDMRFVPLSGLFGREKDESFKGRLGAVFQSFAGKDVYPTVQEKAANLLYLVVKNHSFHDGNKRIAAAVFLYFLDKTGLLLRNGKKSIPDSTLVALTILIAESKPQEKEIMVNLIMHFLECDTENK